MTPSRKKLITSSVLLLGVGYVSDSQRRAPDGADLRSKYELGIHGGVRAISSWTILELFQQTGRGP